MNHEPVDAADKSLSHGRYANYFEIGHNAFEFLLDFGQCYAETSIPQVHTRIVTPPSYAKALSKILGTAIEQYEQTFGSIPDPMG